MEFKKPRGKPEKAGSDRLRELMKQEGWYTKKTHGSMFSEDWPDLYAMHPKFGQRWIETKAPKGALSDGQIKEFHIWSKHGVGVWVLRDEKDYKWLFEEPNWYKFCLPGRLRPE